MSWVYLLTIPDCTTICSFYYSNKGQNGKRPWTINNTYWFRAIIPFFIPSLPSETMPYLAIIIHWVHMTENQATWLLLSRKLRNTTKNIIETFGFVNLISVLIYTCWCKGGEKYKIAANDADVLIRGPCRLSSSFTGAIALALDKVLGKLMN